ncbi:MAG: UDP-N-acetylmuramoyl-tripeptide--D-alanyl-D-alanine ligase [Ignavibacteria bacterium]|nr:UDP-N-acetylmuramoyl-tripeptide--D-alanyl-D-alanine ligase [Ignavibacteria bacterium]
MLKNKAKFTSAEIIAIFGEDNVLNVRQNEFIGVSIDTRSTEAGEIFVPLIGEKIDAHELLPDAFSKGASLAIVSKSWFNNNAEKVEGKPLVLVEHTLRALGELALFHRNRFNIPIIAVAGSNGKTTTKDMIAAVLSRKFKVLKTFQNFNNRIGVPLMIFNLDEAIECAVIEIGTNEPGEIFILSEILAPTEGIITNIGQEHLEKLIDLDGVEMEETSLFGYLQRFGGTCFINCDDERLSKYQRILDKKFTYSTNDEEVNLKVEIEINSNINPILKYSVGENRNKIQLNTYGIASGYNAVAAIAIGKYFEIDDAEIKLALESFEQEKYSGYARMMLQEIEGYTILNDCYNANPSSMKMSIETLQRYQGKPKRAAILGDMRELGEKSFELHLEVLRYASNVCDRVFATGDFMQKASEKLQADNVEHYSDLTEIANEIKELKNDYVFLLKGSRGMKMERIIEMLN